MNLTSQIDARGSMSHWTSCTASRGYLSPGNRVRPVRWCPLLAIFVGCLLSSGTQVQAKEGLRHVKRTVALVSPTHSEGKGIVPLERHSPHARGMGGGGKDMKEMEPMEAVGKAPAPSGFGSILSHPIEAVENAFYKLWSRAVP